MITAESVTGPFFDHYADALLDRDADRVADLYSVPALLLFPGRAIAVDDRQQTRAFFADAFGQYEGVTSTRTEIRVTASTAHSVWADVTWHHDPGAEERLMYQLVDDDGDWRIAVLTPL